MSITRIDLDMKLLDQVAALLGTTTKEATVNEALLHVVNQALRHAHLEELASGALPDMSDPAIMKNAWR